MPGNKKNLKKRIIFSHKKKQISISFPLFSRKKYKEVRKLMKHLCHPIDRDDQQQKQ